MVTLQQLQAAFPANEAFQTLQQETFDFWVAEAYSRLNADRLGTQLDFAALLFVAHSVTMDAKSPGGSVVAPLSSKSVGGASGSYDLGAVTFNDAGEFNATVYGQRLWPILRGAAMGGLYIPPPMPLPSAFRRRGGSW